MWRFDFLSSNTFQYACKLTICVTTMEAYFYFQSSILKYDNEGYLHPARECKYYLQLYNYLQGCVIIYTWEGKVAD